MVLVDMIIAERVNKVSHCQITDVRDHMHQQSIRTDVEWNTKKGVGGALVELAMQNAAVLNLKLKQRMAGRQVNIAGLPRIPTRHDEPSGVWIPMNFVDESRDLVDPVALG